MVTTLTKKGRPIKVYRTSWGEQIPGLTRMKDGRWRVSGADQVTFSEQDERLAIARFLQLKEARERPKFIHLDPHTTPHLALPPAPVAAANAKRAEILITPEVTMKGANIAAEYTVSHGVEEAAFWAKVREELLTRPKHAALRTGLESLAWLPELKRPEPSAKLSTLIDTYTAKPKLSPNEASRSKLFWKQFTKAIGVEHVGEVGHPQVVEYERVILGSGLAAKSIHHRFSKVRTVFAYAIKRGIDIQGCRKVLDALAMLEIKDAHPMDPKPIDVADFWAIHAQAVEADDTTFATFMLTALNCCAYAGEVASMKWPEVDLKAGSYVGRRPKTKISRVAMLWPEVLKGLKQIEKRPGVDYIFNGDRRSFTCNGVLKLWRRYREAAGLGEDVTFGRIRDAAYSLACQNASLDQAKVLAGHAFGGASDFYIRRNPEFVTDACGAIRKAFYAKQR